MPPNVTGWCDSLESFLGGLNYKLVTWVCLTHSREIHVTDREIEYPPPAIQ